MELLERTVPDFVGSNYFLLCLLPSDPHPDPGLDQFDFSQDYPKSADFFLGQFHFKVGLDLAGAFVF